MKFLLSAIFLLFSCAAVLADSIETAFSPNGGATSLIIKTIREAEQNICVAAYSFTSKKIADALIAAKKQGIAVKVTLDGNQHRSDEHSVGTYLRASGVQVGISDQYGLMHNKFMVIDGKTVELGSFNYTNSAEKYNAENVLVVHGNDAVAKKYSEQCNFLWMKSSQ